MCRGAGTSRRPRAVVALCARVAAVPTSSAQGQLECRAIGPDVGAKAGVSAAGYANPLARVLAYPAPRTRHDRGHRPFPAPGIAAKTIRRGRDDSALALPGPMCSAAVQCRGCVVTGLLSFSLSQAGCGSEVVCRHGPVRGGLLAHHLEVPARVMSRTGPARGTVLLEQNGPPHAVQHDVAVDADGRRVHRLVAMPLVQLLVTH